jgi:hypothetical protein
MYKPLRINASSTRFFTDLSDIVNNMTSIWAVKADKRYRALAGLIIAL